jgi:uncharacterized protein (TIGR02284 family)
MADTVASTLNDLIETAKDGEAGFRHAAEHVKDTQLRSLFERYAQQRASFVQELQTLVSDLGGKPAESGHLASSLHRGWISIKDAVTRGDDKAIVDEAEHGEDVAVEAYRKALSSGLTGSARSIVERQFAGVQEAHGTVRDLKHSWRGSASTTTA